MAIVLFLIRQLTAELENDARNVLVGTALLVFVFRAMPAPGAGSTWWMIDELGFDQQFMATLSLIGSVLTLAGMFIFRRFMAERSMAYVIGTLTIAGTVLSLPVISMYFGLHEWTSAHTGGVVDARFIAVIDTALESPLGQISMIPMLAWIANSAPENSRRLFAVMASLPIWLYLLHSWQPNISIRCLRSLVRSKIRKPVKYWFLLITVSWVLC